jgi:hypothetical protein
MSIVVTGAAGHLGRLAVEALLRRGVPAGEVVATGRRTESLADLADRGVSVRRADFDDQASLREAFAGATKVLLVSGSEVGQRVRQHANGPLEQENEVLLPRPTCPRASAQLMFPLVPDLAAPTAPPRVPVTCRVLGFSTQAFYKWLTPHHSPTRTAQAA